MTLPEAARVALNHAKRVGHPSVIFYHELRGEYLAGESDVCLDTVRLVATVNPDGSVNSVSTLEKEMKYWMGVGE